MAMLLRTDGTTQTLEMPASLTRAERLKLMQDTVGGWIEVVRLPDGKLLVVDEEGKLRDKPYNEAATAIAAPRLTGDFIVGDALLVTHDEFEGEDEGDE